MDRSAKLLAIGILVATIVSCGGVSPTPNFSFSGTFPNGVTVPVPGSPGGGLSFMFVLSEENGLSDSVTFTLTGLPADASFSPSSPFTIKPGTYVMGLNWSSDVAPGNYTITLQGSLGKVQHAATFTLQVQ